MKTALDINDFFCPTEMRAYLQAPVRVNGKVVASTGHICIVVPDTEQETINCPEDKKESFIKLLGKINENHNFVSIPTDLVMPVKSTCAVCGGTGKAAETLCKECHGDGEVELESDYNEYSCECKSCDGMGTLIEKGGDDKCQRCHGEGSLYNERDYVTVLGVHVNPNYLNLIINVPEIGVFSCPEKRELHFKLGDVRGIIMCVQK
jgi:hypothetical protein